MLDEIAIWGVFTPLLLGFGLHCKKLLEDKKYGSVAWYVSLFLHFVRIGTLRLATHGGALSYSETSLLFQILGSDYVFAAIALGNFLAFIWHLRASGFDYSWLRLKKRAVPKTSDINAVGVLVVQDEDEDPPTEAEVKLRSLFSLYVNNNNQRLRPELIHIQERRKQSQ